MGRVHLQGTCLDQRTPQHTPQDTPARFAPDNTQKGRPPDLDLGTLGLVQHFKRGQTAGEGPSLLVQGGRFSHPKPQTCVCVYSRCRMQEATNLAMRCITRSQERGMSQHGACRVAASVLTKVAMERGSRDNITVIVIDVTLPASALGAQEAEGCLVPSSAQSGAGSGRGG